MPPARASTERCMANIHSLICYTARYKNRIRLGNWSKRHGWQSDRREQNWCQLKKLPSYTFSFSYMYRNMKINVSIHVYCMNFYCVIQIILLLMLFLLRWYLELYLSLFALNRKHLFTLWNEKNNIVFNRYLHKIITKIAAIRVF